MLPGVYDSGWLSAMDSDVIDPTRTVAVLVGANPFVTLYDEAQRPVFYASMWRVDWSLRGAGTAIVVWRRGETVVYSADLALASWLEHEFTREFPEVKALAWPEPILHETPVMFDLDLSTGVLVETPDLRLRLGDVGRPRPFRTDDFRLAGRPHGLSLVSAPCFTLNGHWRDEPLEGRLQTEGNPGSASSSACVTDAEVWTRKVQR